MSRIPGGACGCWPNSAPPPMPSEQGSSMTRAAATYVEETAFGFWFLQSHVWQQHVLRVAVDDLKRLIDAPLPSSAVLLDAGCGQGKSFGLLLFAESTRFYIDTWVIRWLFRHPMQVQKSAGQYLDMLREQGFEFAERNVSYPYLWWSRAKDFGLLERWGLRQPKPLGQRDETLVNLVARKPLEHPHP